VKMEENLKLLSVATLEVKIEQYNLTLYYCPLNVPKIMFVSSIEDQTLLSGPLMSLCNKWDILPCFGFQHLMTFLHP